MSFSSKSESRDTIKRAGMLTRIIPNRKRGMQHTTDDMVQYVRSTRRQYYRNLCVRWTPLNTKTVKIVNYRKQPVKIEDNLPIMHS